MIDKDWDDIPYVDGDCIRDEAEWTDMITYIKHSASIDFTIYDDEASSNQVFRFTQDGTESKMYGGGDSGDDLLFYANDVSSLYMALMNTGEFQLHEGATQFLEVLLNGAITEIIGGTLSTHDISIQPNSGVGSPKLLMYGNSSSYYDIPTGSHFYWRSGFTTFLDFYESGTDDCIEGSTAANDLKIIGANGIHNYFKAGEEFKLFDGTDEALKVTHAANVTTIEGTDDTGGGLVLKGSSANDYSKIVIAGNSNMEFYVPDGGGIFKFYDGADWCGFMQDDVPNTSFILGTQSDKDLWFKPNGTGEVRWGTEVTNAGSDRGKLIPMRTDGGVLVYIKTYDLV